MKIIKEKPDFYPMQCVECKDFFMVPAPVYLNTLSRDEIRDCCGELFSGREINGEYVCFGCYSYRSHKSLFRKYNETGVMKNGA